jgi:hypothetical protein
VFEDGTRQHSFGSGVPGHPLVELGPSLGAAGSHLEQASDPAKVALKSISGWWFVDLRDGGSHALTA